MKYLLGTGYYVRDPATRLDWFAKVWLKNTLWFAEPLPRQIVVLSVGDSHPPFREVAQDDMITPLTVIDLEGNLGHIHQFIGKMDPPKEHRYCGVTFAFIVLASIAYANECDFVYKEQDCLAFGPWLHRLYAELGDGSMIFGKTRAASSAQSLFLVRYWHIPYFIASLIDQGDDRDPNLLAEDKFTMMLKDPKVKQFSFGYDRDRPFRATDSVWYAQKYTPGELRYLMRLKLLEDEPVPDTDCFTNDITDRFKVPA